MPDFKVEFAIEVTAANAKEAAALAWQYLAESQPGPIAEVFEEESGDKLGEIELDLHNGDRPLVHKCRGKNWY